MTICSPELCWQVLCAVVINVHSDDDISFTVQTNSSVQWFKGDWQHPNTYVQVATLLQLVV